MAIGDLIPVDFQGMALPLNESAFSEAARKLQCDEAAIRAVADVEGGGRFGYLDDGRPLILFEAHIFGALTKHRFSDSHPHISARAWDRTLYRGGAGEYERLRDAAALARDAALQSCSWGRWQILGRNWRSLGYSSISHMVSNMCGSEGDQLDAFVRFVLVNRLDDDLRDLRWDDFARAYNGPGYRRNRYAEKMGVAYARYSGELTSKVSVARPSTAAIQRALLERGFFLDVDGVTGPQTRDAVRDFQRREGLMVDGIAGAETLAALGFQA